jgi:hypothetical protein
MKWLLGILCVVGFCGCKPQYSDFFPYHDDGTPKPNVALVPLIDESGYKLPWDNAKELTAAVRNALMKDGQLFLPRDAEIQKGLSACTKKDLTNFRDLMPFLYFQPAHFVVVIELVEHKVVPYVRGHTKPIFLADIHHDNAEVLMMKVRLRVVDIRGGEPKVIRQEIIESNHMIRKGALAESEAEHGTKAYETSTLNIAYQRLVRSITDSIENITSYTKR